MTSGQFTGEERDRFCQLLAVNTSWGHGAEIDSGVMNPDKKECGGGNRGAHRLSGELMNTSLPRGSGSSYEEIKDRRHLGRRVEPREQKGKDFRWSSGIRIWKSKPFSSKAVEGH